MKTALGGQISQPDAQRGDWAVKLAFLAVREPVAVDGKLVPVVLQALQ